MVTYRIFVDAVTGAQEELSALLDTAPAGTVLRQNFARKPVLFGEQLYYQLDVVLAGEAATNLTLELKRRYSTDMQRIA